MAPAPGKRERPKINLALAARRRLEPDRSLDRLARPHRAHVVPHTRVAARVARGADLIEQPRRRELRVCLETRVDDPLVRVQLVRHRRARRILSRTGQQIPVQLTGLDPIVDRPRVYPEPPRQLRLRNALIQIVLQQHPDLPSVHPRTFPALLAKPTSRPGAPSSTSQNCEILGCHKWEIYSCHQHRSRNRNPPQPCGALSTESRQTPITAD